MSKHVVQSCGSQVKYSVCVIETLDPLKHLQKRFDFIKHNYIL